ncbi:MAG: beta-lactamase domain protein [Verrucomicrobiaceae bacterium]|nr:beta-lactamase domain protein [Verrucomicrobiaceae bacterium]
MLKLTILGSGSSGNCTVVSTDHTTLLVDAGLSAKQITLRLEAAGFDPASLDGILLTHEHGDHTAGLEIFTKKWGVPIYATSLTQECIEHQFRHSPRWKLMRTGSPFELKDLRIECFSVPHDAVDPVGFILQDIESKLGFVSDVGFITNVIRDRLQGAHTLFLEANYDTHLLEADDKRPWSTKQRISSRHGHLSNEQAAELVAAIAHDTLHQVILGHLSEDCNHPDTAVGFIREVLTERSFHEVDVWCADRKTASTTRDVAKRRPIPVAETRPVVQACFELEFV